MSTKKLSVNKACVFLGLSLLIALSVTIIIIYKLTGSRSAVLCCLLFCVFVSSCVICFVALLRRKLTLFSDLFCRTIDDMLSGDIVPPEMGIILNNGLDNAMEACMRMREKQPNAEAYITIRSFRARNMYFIEIENSFDGTALFDKDSGFPISTKEDKEVHGIGLKNIRKCAVKYGGDMDCIVKGNRFTLSVMVKS